MDRVQGERRLRPEFAGLNRLEFAFLAVLMPLMLLVLVMDSLWPLGGGWLAGLATFPVFWVLLHVIPLVMGAGKPVAAFWTWTCLLSGWALWRIVSGEGWVNVLACGFLVFAILNAVLLIAVPIWRRLMSVRGWAGVTVRIVLFGLAHLPAIAMGIGLGLGWGIVGAVATGLCWVAGTFLPGAEFFGPVVRRVEGDELLITIDDGPDPNDTDRLLDLLEKHDLKAVFFVIGERVQRYPELARAIVARGHELGNHSMTHPQATMWCAGPWRTRREIHEAQRVIEEVTGTVPRWYRAPVGHRNYFTHPFAAECGLEVVAWTRRGYDTVEKNVEKIVSALTDGAGAGDILLLHEGTPVAAEVMEGVLGRKRA